MGECCPDAMDRHTASQKNRWTLDASIGGYAPQADLLHMLRFAELSGIAS